MSVISTPVRLLDRGLAQLVSIGEKKEELTVQARYLYSKRPVHGTGSSVSEGQSSFDGIAACSVLAWLRIVRFGRGGTSD